MENLTLFDGPTLRDAGIKLAEWERTLICQAVDKAIKMLAGAGEPFTAEGVRTYAASLAEQSALALTLYGPAEKAPHLALLKERLAA